MLRARFALALSLAGFAAGGGCGGSSWSLPLSALDRVPLSVWQPSAHEAFVSGGPLGSAGEALLLHFDGTAWTQIPTGTNATLWWVFGLGPTDVYAVGEQGTVVHWDGAQLSTIASGTTRTLYGVWGTGDGDLWAVGGAPDVDGVILHRDASGFHPVAVATNSGAFFKVWGSSSADVFICGQGGTVLHWDGTALQRQSTGLAASVPLFTIAGRAGSDVYAVGGVGAAVALHYDGASWAPLSDPALVGAQALAGVAVDASGALLLVGANGTALRGKLGGLADESRLVTGEDLHAASVRGGEAFAVGGNYFSPAPIARHGVVAHYGGPIARTLR